MPGWDRGSWGYHGYNGMAFHNHEARAGETYGPTFTTGDVVGCCLDFGRQLAFYTKNGKLLDAAFTDILLRGVAGKIEKDEIYPFIGFNSGHVSVNFGREPFLFDIASHLKM